MNIFEFDEVEKVVKDQIVVFLNNKGIKLVDYFYKCLGYIMWNKVGMVCNEKGLMEVIEEIVVLRVEFYQDVFVLGEVNELNFELEKVFCVVDFMELG